MYFRSLVLILFTTILIHNNIFIDLIMRHHILFWIKHPWVRYPKKNSRPGMFLSISWVWHMSELIFIIDVGQFSCLIPCRIESKDKVKGLGDTRLDLEPAIIFYRVKNIQA